MGRSRYVPLATMVVVSLTLMACDGVPAADPLEAYPQFGADGGGPSLLVCPSSEERVYTFTVGPEGGVLSGRGIEVVLPAGALSESTEFRAVVPASSYVEVDITANGQEHFDFLKPVTVTIGYGRCDDVSGLLSVWYIDGDQKTMLEDMGGVDDRLSRKITFSTTHLSGYAIAN